MFNQFWESFLPGRMPAWLPKLINSFCSVLEMVKCTVLSDLERRGSCMKDSDGSDFLYLPIIIIATVGIIVATVSIGFAVKLLIKHFNDNGVHNIESSQTTSRYDDEKQLIANCKFNILLLYIFRTCSPRVVSPSTATPGTALLTPEREQRRPDSQVREDHSNCVQIICVYFFSAAGGSYKHGDSEEHRSSVLWWSVRPHQQGRAAPVPGYCPWRHMKTDTGSATCQTKTQYKHKIKYLQVIVLQMQYLSLSINLHSENSSFIHYKPHTQTLRKSKNNIGSVVAGVGFSPPRSVNLPFCHLGLLKGRFSSL